MPADISLFTPGGHISFLIFIFGSPRPNHICNYNICELVRYCLYILFVFMNSQAYCQTKHVTRYLSIGTKSAGLCFGNSTKYSGLRLNLFDTGADSSKFNGLNVSLFVKNELANGIQIGGLVVHLNRFNGISMSSIWLSANRLNGMGVSFGIDCDTLNGLFIGFGVGSTDPLYPNNVLNGVGMGLITVGAEKVKGVTVSVFKCYSIEHYGLSIGAVNKTESLHGLQLGLLNYAGNNPKLLRWLPLINFHL